MTFEFEKPRIEYVERRSSYPTVNLLWNRWKGAMGLPWATPCGDHSFIVTRRGNNER